MGKGFCRLSERGFVRISGKDRRSFLQSLVTNNVDLLDTQPCIYACLLSPQGKFLHDFFVTESGDELRLDCEGAERVQDLAKRLTMYKLRADVNIAVDESVDVFAGFDREPENSFPDPRNPDMGWRSYMQPEGEEQPFDYWDRQRIELEIPDGSRDLIVNKSTMDEGRMDQFNAVDYDKGCYVGQELTARMHYRGLGKKHLRKVDVNNLPEKAELRSQCGDVGLALVRNN